MRNRELAGRLPEIGPGVSVHFIGVGGIGMSGLAGLCLDLGCRVSGSDLTENPRTQDLARRGADIRIGKETEWVCRTDIVVYSSAVPETHSEREAALRAGVPVIRRGTLLAALTRNYHLLAVAGTHGKTTTCSMLALALRSAGLDPTILVGGELPEIGGNAVLGTDRYCVAETDESDGSFLELDPHLAVVTNVEDDHLEYYGNIPSLQKAFVDFLAAVGSGEKRIVCTDCPNLYSLARKEFDDGITGYGFSEWSTVRGTRIRLDKTGSQCRVLFRGEPVGELRLRVPGRHMLSNALGVYAAALVLGLPLEKVAYGLSEYRGTRRRFEVLGKWRGATLIDDYAHHPTEIRATLQALHQTSEGRCIAVFQPHRFSRTDQLFDRYADTFGGVDLLVLTEIYPAGEQPRTGVSSKHLLSTIQGVGKLCYAPTLDDTKETLRRVIEEGDTVLFLGAGDVNRVAYELLEEKMESE